MRILVAVDLTDADADMYVGQAASWARALEATADLVFVDEAADENPYIYDAALRGVMSTHYDAWHAKMRNRLDELVQSLPREIRGEGRVVRGRATPELLKLLPDYDTIVLGNRAVSGLSRLAHGVVAERVSRASDKPVVILPRQ